MSTLYYAETRLPGVSRSAFLARWRAHGGLALESPTFRGAVSRYVHHDPVHDAVAFPGASTAYDALGEIACPDTTTLRGLLTSEDLLGPIRADGARTFARTRTVEAIVDQRVLRDGPAPVSASAFVAGDLSPVDLADALAEILLSLTAGGALRSLVRRLAVSPAIDEDARWGSFLELGFADLAAAAHAHSAWLPAFIAAAAPLVTDLRVIVSVRCPLFDPAPLGA